MCCASASLLQPLASGQSNDEPKTFWRHHDARSEIASAYGLTIAVSTRLRRERTLMTLKQVADVEFPTRWASFRLLAFEAIHANTKTGKERLETVLALVLGDIHGKNGFEALLAGLCVGMNGLEGQKAKTRPARWKLHIGDLLQCHQCPLSS